ncbi:hypothetical protein WJX84_012268 [Apatococcus fuscideae]|uniref:Uncharacterized protein n=1 Tax=Apatococcus fuscideae TaxID=2026836 RepID=A0AAW1T4J3_9CHLO
MYPDRIVSEHCTGRLLPALERRQARWILHRMARQPSPARQSRVASDSSKLPHNSGSSRRARSASSVSLPGVDRSSSSTTSSSADSASHTDGSFGQSDKMSEHQTVLLDEIHRLTPENASLHHKLESSVVAPQTPEAKENGTAHSGLREQNKTLANENSRLQEQIAQLERRILTGKAPMPGAGKEKDGAEDGRDKSSQTELRRLRLEHTTLLKENQRLSYEIYEVNKVATLVASRVAKVLVGARRSSNFNSALTTELKRWNRKLEFENHRLYEIIDKLSSGNATSLTAELKAKSSSKGHESAQLVKRLEDQNKNLQEEINRLSTDTAIMQSMAVRADSDASPRAPSNTSSILSSLPTSDDTRQHSPGKHSAANSRPASGTGSEASAELIEDLQNENLRLNAEIVNLQAELQALRDSTATLTDKARLVEELTDANSKLQQEARSVDSLADENADLREEVGRLNSCTVLLEAKVALVNELDEENKRAFEEVATLTQELARWRGSSSLADELQLQSKKHRDDMRGLTSELVELRSQQAHATQASSQQQQQQQQKQADERMASLLQQVAKLEEEVDQRASEGAVLRSKQVHQEHLEGKVGSLQEELSQLQGQHAEAQARAAAADGLQHANTKLQHEISKAHLEMDHLERKAAAAAQADSLHSQVRDLQAEIAAITSQHAAALDSRRTLEDKHALMTQELNELRAKKADADSEISISARAAPASPAKPNLQPADSAEDGLIEPDLLAAYVEGIEAGQPLPHLATENKALQDMHKQLAGWISDIRERKTPDDPTSPTPATSAPTSPTPPTSAPTSPTPAAMPPSGPPAANKGRMAAFFQRTNPNRTSRESRVRELLRNASSQARPSSPNGTAEAAPAAASPADKADTPAEAGANGSAPASKLSPFARQAGQPAAAMPSLAAVNTRRVEPARSRSMGADSMMQQTADKQASNAYQKFRGANDVAHFLMALGYGGHIKPDQSAQEMLSMALNLTHRDQLQNVSAWERACGTATHAKLKQWWVGEIGTQLPIID